MKLCQKHQCHMWNKHYRTDFRFHHSSGDHCNWKKT